MEEYEGKREKAAVTAEHQPMHAREKRVSADADGADVKTRPAGTGVRSASETKRPTRTDAPPEKLQTKTAVKLRPSEVPTKQAVQRRTQPTETEKEQTIRLFDQNESPKKLQAQKRTKTTETEKEQTIRLFDQNEAPKKQQAQKRTQPSAAPKKQTNQSDEQPETPKKRKSDLFYGAFGLLVKIAWIALSLFLLLQFVVGVHKNTGVGMEPAFHDRDLVFYNRLANSFEAGDVVVFKRQNGNEQVGRIVAAAGDTVEIAEGGLKLNGYFQTEPYAVGETVQFEGFVTYPVTLGKDEYFILFDNRAQGGDSRTLGKISANEIRGHVILTIRARDF